jgi:hypothetical protein
VTADREPASARLEQGESTSNVETHATVSTAELRRRLDALDGRASRSRAWPRTRTAARLRGRHRGSSAGLPGDVSQTQESEELDREEYEETETEFERCDHQPRGCLRRT